MALYHLKTSRALSKTVTASTQQRILNALEQLLVNPTQTDFKKLRGREGYRLRVGDYRILIQVNREEQVFIITEIGSRGDIYK